jgi:hypothetical protein
LIFHHWLIFHNWLISWKYLQTTVQYNVTGTLSPPGQCQNNEYMFIYARIQLYITLSQTDLNQGVLFSTNHHILKGTVAWDWDGLKVILDRSVLGEEPLMVFKSLNAPLNFMVGKRKNKKRAAEHKKNFHSSFNF